MACSASSAGLAIEMSRLRVTSGSRVLMRASKVCVTEVPHRRYRSAGAELDHDDVPSVIKPSAQTRLLLAGTPLRPTAVPKHQDVRPRDGPAPLAGRRNIEQLACGVVGLGNEVIGRPSGFTARL